VATNRCSTPFFIAASIQAKNKTGSLSWVRGARAPRDGFRRSAIGMALPDTLRAPASPDRRRAQDAHIGIRAFAAFSVSIRNRGTTRRIA
jgi:hypothetical protein